MREVIFIKSLYQDIVLFLYKTVNFKTTTESLGKIHVRFPCEGLVWEGFAGFAWFAGFAVHICESSCKRIVSVTFVF